MILGALAGLALADADEHAQWTEGIDAVLDQAMVEFTPCVAYTEAVEAGHVDLLVFELHFAGKRASPTLQLMSMNEPSMTPCFLRVLRQQDYPLPANGESAFVFIEIANLKPRRGAPTVFRDANPATGEQSTLPKAYLHQIIDKVSDDWARACVQPLVNREAGDVGATVREALVVNDDGTVTATQYGKSVMPEVEACIHEHVGRLSFPPGFGDTGKLTLTVSLSGTGGEYAGGERRWNLQWNWRIQTWLGWYDTGRRYSRADPAHLLISTELSHVMSAEELRGCLVKWPAEPGLVLPGETRHDGEGGRSTVVRPGGNLAVCAAEVLDRVPAMPSKGVASVTFWMQLLPQQKLTIAPPEIPGLAASWGPRQPGLAFRSLVMGPWDYTQVDDRLRTARRAIDACRSPSSRGTGGRDQVLIDARFDGPTGKVVDARILDADVEESVEACVLAAATSKGLDEPLGTGELRVIYTATLPERE